MGYFYVRALEQFLFLFAVFTLPSSRGTTDPRDVNAIKSLYAALGSPQLTGWTLDGGDPCGLAWQGVQCVNANVTGIVLNGLNLGGQLSVDLGFFASIIQIDLRDNHIGGPIPSNLPPTVRSLFLSGNQLTGSIPDAISSLGQLSDLYVDNNRLQGVIPDAFQQLKGLVTIDFSGNKLTGQLPSSMGNLSSLMTLHLQNNQLIGTLDVLEDLSLTDLNIENNLFSGPIPENLLRIPSFRKDGNPFNTTVLPSPPVPAPLSSPAPISAFSPELTPPSRQIYAPPPPMSTRNNVKPSKNMLWTVVVIVLVAIILVILIACLLRSQCCLKRPVNGKIHKGYQMYARDTARANHKSDASLQNSRDEASRVTRESILNLSVGNSSQGSAQMGSSILPPPPPPFQLSSCESSIPDPILPILISEEQSVGPVSLELLTVKGFERYTLNFSEENFIGKGMLGAVYKAKLPDGTLVAVKKLHDGVSRHKSDREFLDLVGSLSRLQHHNVVKLVGHCLENRQRFLVYEYCKTKTLHEALHEDNEIRARLSWKTRVRLALEAAQALKYLHEKCEPPVVHQNFKAANILLDKDLSVRVSDCGLAPLLPSNSMAKLLDCGYGAPELGLRGNYMHPKSDVYSFGVVMLELLTGRKSRDRSRPHGEQFLVRWAHNQQLHDKEALPRIVDPSLNAEYSSASLSSFADLISMCILTQPDFRPSMSEVVKSLTRMIKRDL